MCLIFELIFDILARHGVDNLQSAALAGNGKARTPLTLQNETAGFLWRDAAGGSVKIWAAWLLPETATTYIYIYKSRRRMMKGAEFYTTTRAEGCNCFVT